MIAVMSDSVATGVGAVVWALLIGMLIPSTRYLAIAAAGVGFIAWVGVAHLQGAPL